MSSVASDDEEDPPESTAPLHMRQGDHDVGHSLSSSSLPSFTSSDGEQHDGDRHNDYHDRISEASSVSDSEDDTSPLDAPLAAFSHNFAPPFYNRPPTPLPPSPSLTSLLRASRPTSPSTSDHGDDDLGPSFSTPGNRRTSTTGLGLALRRASYTTTASHTAANSSAASNSHLPITGPVPLASPRVPTYEYYGFVLYLLSSALFFVYLLWSYTPSPLLHALGIRYYPDRWWSLAIPSFLVMGVVYVYVALASYNVEVLTLPMGSVETIVDGAADVAVLDGPRRKGKGRGKKGSLRRGGTVKARRKSSAGAGIGVEEEKLDWRTAWCMGTDAVMDVPLAGVCEVLYGDGMDAIGDDDGVG